MEEKELQEFAIPEDGDKYKIASSLEELEKLDFSDNTPLTNLDEYYEMVNTLQKSNESIKKENKEALEAQQSEITIKRDGEKFLGKEVFELFEKERQKLKNFLRKYEVNTEEVKNMSDSDKSKLYAISGYLFDAFQKIHNNLNFILPLSLEEYKFINEVLVKKLEYDFENWKQIKDYNFKKTYLDRYPKFVKNDVNDNEMKTVIDINDFLLLYGQLARYKVKGMQTEFDLFSSVLQKMGDRFKLYYSYNIIATNLSQEFVVWGGAISVDNSDITVGNTGDQSGSDQQDDLKVVDEVSGEEK